MSARLKPRKHGAYIEDPPSAPHGATLLVYLDAVVIARIHVPALSPGSLLELEAERGKHGRPDVIV